MNNVSETLKGSKLKFDMPYIKGLCPLLGPSTNLIGHVELITTNLDLLMG